MNEPIKLDIDILCVAAHLAHCNDEVQGEFFDIFVQELYKQCGTDYKTGLQMAFIARKIKPQTKEFFGHMTYDEKEKG